MEMSFVYFLNNNYITLTPVDQIQTYYPPISSFYQNTQENITIPQYSINWTFNDKIYQPESSLPAFLISTIPQEHQKTQKQQKISTSKRNVGKTLDKQILSAKKNSQSNIINQFYSFFNNRQRSEKVVEKCCILMNKSLEESQKMINKFYMTIRYINMKRGRKYVNSSMFLKFFSEESFLEYISEMNDKIVGQEFVQPADLCQICRRCAKYFLRNISINGILTSKRISMISKEEHLKKRRKIVSSIMNRQ